MNICIYDKLHFEVSGLNSDEILNRLHLAVQSKDGIVSTISETQYMCDVIEDKLYPVQLSCMFYEHVDDPNITILVFSRISGYIEAYGDIFDFIKQYITSPDSIDEYIKMKKEPLYPGANAIHISLDEIECSCKIVGGIYIHDNVRKDAATTIAKHCRDIDGLSDRIKQSSTHLQLIKNVITTLNEMEDYQYSLAKDCLSLIFSF